jgi:hypothetical protein
MSRNLAGKLRTIADSQPALPEEDRERINRVVRNLWFNVIRFPQT